MAAMMNMNNLLNGKDSRWLQLEVCREFQRNKCSRQDTECKFAHPPANVEVQNGKVTACYDSIKGRCNREKPPCKYFHPPQHLKDQLLINGRNHLALKNALMQQMAITSGQPVMPGQVPTVDVQNGTTSVPPLGFSVTVGSQPIMATNPYLTGIPASTYSPYFAPGHLVPALLGPDPSAVATQLGPVVPQTVPVAQQKIARSDRLEVCREFMRGACKRAESECRFAHPQESVTTHEDGSVTVCMDAVKGRCARDLCRYFHPPLHLQAQIKTAQLRAVATAPVSASAAAGPVLTAAVAAAAMTHPIPTPGPAPSTAMAFGHPLEVGKKRAAENDMFQLMDMKTAFSGMVPYKRPAAEKSGIPVYQPGATTYQQLMQLQQPFVPVSCEYPSPSPSASTAIPQSSTTANSIANNNKNQISLNNSNSNGVVVNNRTLYNNLLSNNISNISLSSSNGMVVTTTPKLSTQNVVTTSQQNSAQQSFFINNKNTVNNNNINHTLNGSNTNNANNDNNNNINTSNNNGTNPISPANNNNNNNTTNTNNNNNIDNIPNGTALSNNELNNNSSLTNNASNVNNNGNNLQNVESGQLTTVASAVTPPTTSSVELAISLSEPNAPTEAVATISSQQLPLTQASTTSTYTNCNHQSQSLPQTPTLHHTSIHSQHPTQTQQTAHLHHASSQNSLNASLLSHATHPISSAVTVQHPSIPISAAHHAYYHDPATIAKEVAQKNYANALKMAAASCSFSGKPLSALSYTGVALNKALVQHHPGSAAAAAAAAANYQASVANRMGTSMPGVMSNVPQSTPSFTMTRPPPGFVQTSQFLRQHAAHGLAPTPTAAAAAPNPYSTATSAVGSPQFLNHQNFFYPGLMAGYPFGMSAATGLAAQTVPQTVPANFAGIPTMPGVPQVGTAAATPGSAVVLNPYKKMKTS